MHRDLRFNRSGSRPSRRAALLLEVVVALTIVVAALGLLGGQIAGGLKLVQDAEVQTRAGEMGDRLLALLELDQELQKRIFVDNDMDGEFGEEYPGWFWQIQLEPAATEGLGIVTLSVLFDSQRGDDIGDGRVVRRLHMLKADPGRINFENDFGVPLEQIETVTGGALIPGFDPTAFDPQALLSLPPEQLLGLIMQLMPLLQQLPGGAGLLSQFGGAEGGPASPEQFREMLQGAAAGGALPGLPGATPRAPAGARDSGGNRDSVAGDLSPDGAPNQPATPNAPTIRPGNRSGAPRGGAVPGGGAGNRGAGGGGGNRGGTSVQTGGGEPRYTIEDLMRLREGQRPN
ncbi:MAG: hypothetical protein HRU75_09995 [Planctomycetia bacterium]|nr:MAG: hypothetical protein HRU75_09995 [Planctomycetia bacterium]